MLEQVCDTTYFFENARHAHAVVRIGRRVTLEPVTNPRDLRWAEKAAEARYGRVLGLVGVDDCGGLVLEVVPGIRRPEDMTHAAFTLGRLLPTRMPTAEPLPVSLLLC